MFSRTFWQWTEISRGHGLFSRSPLWEYGVHIATNKIVHSHVIHNHFTQKWPYWPKSNAVLVMRTNLMQNYILSQVWTGLIIGGGAQNNPLTGPSVYLFAFVTVQYSWTLTAAFFIQQYSEDCGEIWSWGNWALEFSCKVTTVAVFADGHLLIDIYLPCSTVWVEMILYNVQLLEQLWQNGLVDFIGDPITFRVLV